MPRKHDEVQDGIEKYTDYVNTLYYTESIRRLSDMSTQAAIEGVLGDILEAINDIHRQKRKLTAQEQVDFNIATLKRLIALDACVLRAIPRYPENCDAIKLIHRYVLKLVSPLLNKTHRKYFIQSLQTIDAYAVGHHSPGHPPCYKAIVKPVQEIYFPLRKNPYAKEKQICIKALQQSVILVKLRALGQDLTHYLTLNRINQRRQVTAKLVQSILFTYEDLYRANTLTNDDINTLSILLVTTYRELDRQTSWIDRLRGNRLGKILKRHLSHLPKVSDSTLKLSPQAAKVLNSELAKAEINLDQLSKKQIPKSLHIARHLSHTRHKEKNTLADEQLKRHSQIKQLSEKLLLGALPNKTKEEISAAVDDIPLDKLEGDVNLFIRQHQVKPLNEEAHTNLLVILIKQQVSARLYSESQIMDETTAMLMFQRLNNQFETDIKDFVDTLPNEVALDSALTDELHISCELICRGIFDRFGTQILKLHHLSVLKDIFRKQLTALAEKESGERVLAEIQRLYETLKPDSREDKRSAPEETKSALLKQLAQMPAVKDKLILGFITTLKRLATNINPESLSLSEYNNYRHKIDNLNKLTKAFGLEEIHSNWDNLIKELLPIYYQAQEISILLTTLEYDINSHSPTQLTTVNAFLTNKEAYFRAITQFEDEQFKLLNIAHPEGSPLHHVIKEQITRKQSGFNFGKQLAEWVQSCEALKDKLEAISNTEQRPALAELESKLSALEEDIDSLLRDNNVYAAKINKYKQIILAPLKITLKEIKADRGMHNHSANRYALLTSQGDDHLVTEANPALLPLLSDYPQILA